MNAIQDPIRQAVVSAVTTTPAPPSFDDMLQRAAAQGAMMPDWADHVVAGTPATASRRPKRVATWISSVLAVGLLGGGGYFAYANVVGPDGYESPTAAVDGFLDALEDGNLLRASRALVPFERDSIEAVIPTLLSDAEALGELQSNNPSRAEHISLERNGLTTEEVGLADGIVRVDATGGELNVTFDEQLVGPAIDVKGTVTENLVAKAQRGIGDQNRRPGLVTVRDGGEWYVSLSYTVMEYFRQNDNNPLPDFTVRPGSGASTPEEAATQAFNLAFYGPPTSLGAVIDPVAGQGILPYLPVMDQDRYNAERVDVAWSIEGTGSTRTALGTKITTRGPSGEETRDVTDCATNPECGFVGYLAARGVELVERDGRWYVNPLKAVAGMLPSLFLTPAPGSGSTASGPIEVVPPLAPTSTI